MWKEIKEFFTIGWEVLKERWKDDLLAIALAVTVVSIIQIAVGYTIKKTTMSHIEIAEDVILKNTDQVFINGYHVIYDDAVPLEINNTFNTAKTRRFTPLIINGKTTFQWSQTYADFLDHCKGSPKIGYNCSNPNYLIKCCIDEETARAALNKELRYILKILEFKYAPYFSNLNHHQKAALIAYHHAIGLDKKQPRIYKLLSERPNDAWMGMQDGDPKKLLLFKKLYMYEDPEKK